VPVTIPLRARGIYQCQLIQSLLDSLPVLDLPTVLRNLKYMGCPIARQLVKVAGMLLTHSVWIKHCLKWKTYCSKNISGGYNFSYASKNKMSQVSNPIWIVGSKIRVCLFMTLSLKAEWKENVGIYLYTEKEETHRSPDTKPASNFRYHVLSKKH